jgi:hypothetical protein
MKPEVLTVVKMTMVFLVALSCGHLGRLTSVPKECTVSILSPEVGGSQAVATQKTNIG